MAVAEKNTPNPSGTAVTQGVTKLITGIAGAVTGTTYGIGYPAVALGVGTGVTQLLTNKRFLNLATRFAKEPTEPLAQKLSQLVKESTGMTVQTSVAATKDKAN